MANICLDPRVSASVLSTVDQGSGYVPYVDLSMLKSFLEILVDRLIRDFAQQRQIRDTDFLLLRDLESCLPDLRLYSILLSRPTTTKQRSFGASGSFALSTSRLTLAAKDFSGCLTTCPLILTMFPSESVDPSFVRRPLFCDSTGRD